MNFNTETVAKITGLSRRQVDYWDVIHFIKPSVADARGKGSVRLYSFEDLVQLKVAKSLREKGISLQRIRKAIQYLKKNMPEVSKPLAEMRFLTDGDTIFVITKDTKKIIDTLRNGQIVISIALADLINELRGKVYEIQEEKSLIIAVKGKKYEVLLHPETEDGGYWVECPSLPGCASQGDTAEEALDMIRDAIKGHLEILEEARKKSQAV
jgi:predicted RNase H-like HicB family nuclease